MTIVILNLTACGGGDGVGSGGTGISQFTMAVGSVERLDVMGADTRLVVNGVSFDVSGAQVEIEGDALAREGQKAAAGALARLQPGMTVQVRGSMDAAQLTGRASYVLSVPELRGVVGAVDAAAGRFDAMGVAVAVDEDTVFAGLAGLAELGSGDTVQVHGYPLPDGALRATRVQALAASTAVPPVLVGEVRALDTAAQQFRIGSYTVHYAGAAWLGGASASGPTEGMLVYVTARQPLSDQALVAAQLRPGHRLSQEAGTVVTNSGVVTHFSTLQSFQLQGVQVDASHAQFIGGQSGDMGAGAKVDVVGTMDSAGVLVAERVQVRRAAGGGPAGRQPPPDQPAAPARDPASTDPARQPTANPPQPTSPTAPVEPGQPANPSPGQPANPNPGQPANPNPGQPANPNPGQPANPNPGQPANPNPGQPANPNPGQPANPNPSQPANPNPGQPANPSPGKPVKASA